MVHLHCLRSRVYELFLLIEQFRLPLMINSVKITGSSLENKNKILFFYTYTRLYIYIYYIYNNNYYFYINNKNNKKK